MEPSGNFTGFELETMAIEIVYLPFKNDFSIAMLNYRNVMGSEAWLYHDHLWFRSSHHYDPPSAIEAWYWNM